MSRTLKWMRLLNSVSFSPRAGAILLLDSNISPCEVSIAYRPFLRKCFTVWNKKALYRDEEYFFRIGWIARLFALRLLLRKSAESWVFPKRARLPFMPETL